jgi:hypothetical protein
VRGDESELLVSEATVNSTAALNVIEEPSLTPPLDAELQSLLAGLFKGTVECTEAVIPFGMIVPKDAQHALDLPSFGIAAADGALDAGKQLKLLVYWNGERFVVSDDYALYMAYRARHVTSVPVVILGKVPSSVSPIRSGGYELLPPALIAASAPPASAEAKAARRWWRDVYSSALRQPSESTLQLHVLAMQLAELVARSSTAERDIHEFLLEHPQIFDVYGTRVRSEVRFGSSYRADLVVEYGASDRRIELIELERASHPIFTSKGRLRHAVEYAGQQVEDWIRWWREHSAEVPPPFDASVPLSGAVVVGRSRDLSVDDRKRLLHINDGRRVKILTYDDLLDRIDRVIAMTESP